MKKYLPFILLASGVVLLVIIFIFVKNRNKEEIPEEEVVAEIPFDQRPVTTLTPSEDGHWLTMNVSSIGIEAKSMDYELLYFLPDGRTQGVPGTIKLEGQDNIERKLLLGSESSGKFRYDEGVEKGALTLRFRDEKGKLIGKLTTDFVLKYEVDKISSPDGKFSYTFTEQPEEVYFVVMNTFGVPSNPPSPLQSGPYGLFSSVDGETTKADLLAGTSEITLNVSYLYSNENEWIKHESDSPLETPLSIFVGLSQ